jgi:hypothetical protein
MEADSIIVDQMDEEDEDVILSANNKSKWSARHLNSLEARRTKLQGWTKSLEEYLLCVEDTEDDVKVRSSFIQQYLPPLMFPQRAIETHDARQDAAVTSLREMRAVIPKYYNNNSWRRLVRVRGLLYRSYVAQLHYACSVNWFGQSRLRDLQARQF